METLRSLGNQTAVLDFFFQVHSRNGFPRAREGGREGGRGKKFSRKLESFFSTLRLLTLYKSPSVVSLIAGAAVSSFTDSITDVLADCFIKANTHPGVLNSLRCRKDVIKPIF